MEHKNHKLKEGRAGSDSTRFYIGADAEHDSPPQGCTTLSAPEGKTKIKVNGSRNSPRPSGKSGQKRPSACLPCLPRSCVSFVRRRPLSGGPAFRFFGPFFLSGGAPSLARASVWWRSACRVRSASLAAVASPRSSGFRVCPSRRPFCALRGWRLRGSGASAHKVPPPPRAFPP